MCWGVPKLKGDFVKAEWKENGVVRMLRMGSLRGFWKKRGRWEEMGVFEKSGMETLQKGELKA